MKANIDKSQDFRDGMPFLGGALWLDLANSSFTMDGDACDFLADDTSFARWAEQAEIAIDPASISAERLAALRLRVLARGILAQLDKGETLSDTQIDQLNDTLVARALHERLQQVDGRLELHLPDQVSGPKAAALIASDLAHFLSDHDPARLKSCDSPTCSMVFYDRGKNNRRRWCTMAVCGNRDKVANYRARRAGGKPA